MNSGPFHPDYLRFAEFATMESYEYEAAFDGLAPDRAKHLRDVKWTRPALEEAARSFDTIAAQRFMAVKMRSGTNWSEEEYAEILVGMGESAGNELSETFEILDVFQQTYNKVKLLEMATEKAWNARLDHSRLWQRVLASDKPTGGAERTEFPLRFAIAYGLIFQNVTDKPLTQLTVALKTNSSAELPDDCRLHVVYLSRLDPGESVPLPQRLYDGLWNSDSREFRPGNDVFSVSVWSAEVHFEDVSFDFAPLPAGEDNPELAPKGWCPLGAFPAKDFAGRYIPAADQPQARPLSARELYPELMEGLWIGKDNATQAPYVLDVFELVGEDVTVVKRSDYYTDGLSLPTITLRGKLRGEKIILETVGRYQKEPAFPTLFKGTILGDKMELSYSGPTVPPGTISLQFKRSTN